jgi:hypothetical protein
LKSKTFESVFVNRCFKHQVEMLTKIYKGEMFDTYDAEIRMVLEQHLTKPIFGNAFLAVLLK